MSPKPMSFRFSDEISSLLRVWAFVTDKDQRDILEESFREYMEKRPEIKEKVDNIIREIDK